jgi:ABC-type transport system involved in cytochrome c biogenesis permease subunit
MKKLFVTGLLVLGLFGPARAREISPAPLLKPRGISDPRGLAALPILEDGRVKPLDTFARNLLLKLSGKTSVESERALSWLTRFLFAPESTRDDPVFLINNPAVAEALQIEPRENRRYSFSNLDPVYPQIQTFASLARKIDRKDRDIVENEFIRLHDNLMLYTRLSLSFSFAFPHPDFTITDPRTKDRLGLAEEVSEFSFLGLLLKAEHLRVMTEPLEQKPREEWTEPEKEIVRVITRLFEWSMLYRDIPLAILPAYERPDENWYSAWDVMNKAVRIEEGRRELAALEEMTARYRDGRQLEFDRAVEALKSSVRERAGREGAFAVKRLELEVLSNRLKLLFWAKILYSAGFFSFLLSLIRKNFWLRRLGAAAVVLALLAHSLAMIMRVLILFRPPVSNLYETFVFVALVGALTGLLIEWRLKNWLGIVIAAVNGLVFLLIAGKFSMEGDTMQVLIAVLDSNFWLTTHVLTISVGYSGACVAGLIGHIYLLQAILYPENKGLLNQTGRVLTGALGFGLAMTFLGTNLGGIWADESWGRFWGWDPKENGALMIILWISLIFHARIARLIGLPGLAAGSILGVIVVMWAWFGVNLLGVGLHSYGFTSGLATNLMIYVILQLGFLAVALPLARLRLKKPAGPETAARLRVKPGNKKTDR